MNSHLFHDRSITIRKFLKIYMESGLYIELNN